MKNKQMACGQINKAFSLIELSIVLVIIGILTTGLVGQSGLIYQARLAAARSLVVDSPVPKINNLLFWFEGTTKGGFGIGTATFQKPSNLPNDGQAIGLWKNINPQLQESLRQDVFQQNSVKQPTFVAQSINKLPALRFNGSQYMQNNNLYLNGAELTIFIVAKRNNPTSGASFINLRSQEVAPDYASTNSLIAFDETGQIIGSYRVGPLSSSPHPSNNVPFIAATVFNGVKNVFYLNGSAGPSVATSGSFYSKFLLFACRMATLNVVQPSGCSNGDLAEVIIYRKALNNNERVSVENYLSKKYKITVSQ